jgi:ribonuclease-3
MKYKFKKIPPSYFKHPGCGANPHFQRLEFLGDKILSFFLSNILFRRFPHMTEGNLTITLSNLVNQKILSDKGKDIKNYFQFKNPPNDSILSDCFEVWIGAVFIDGGNIYNILLSIFKKDLHNISPKKDSKNLLQEMSQKHGKIPEYVYTSANKYFTCKVTIDDKSAIGNGSSKKESSRVAASEWLKKHSI